MNDNHFLQKTLSAFVGLFVAITAFVKAEQLKILCYYCLFAGTIGILLLKWLSGKKAQLLAYWAARKKEKLFRDQGNHDNRDEERLLQHVGHRISSTLHNIYADATWEYADYDAAISSIRSGGPFVIKLSGVKEAQEAEVVFDRYARMDCRLIQFIELTKPEPQEPSPTEKPKKKEVNLADWYALKLQRPLEKTVKELTARGHAHLFILENGEIAVQRNGEKQVHIQIKDMVEKDYWTGLQKLMKEESDLNSEIIDNTISIKC